jgi:hypothetical protein
MLLPQLVSDHGLAPSLAMSNGSLFYQTAVLTLTTPFLR